MFESLKQVFRRKPVADPVDIPEGKSAASTRLSTVPRMEEKYPSVRHLAVNLVISPPDHETEPTMNGRSFGPPALAFFEFRCKNVECAHGGFDISDSIAETIEQGQTEVTGRRVCRGWHGKGRINQLRCRYELNFRVNVAYHGEEH
ncbi:MAG: hypothetical protein AB8G17_02380 [Gammaproteobacteria bacterium]